jgi:hypothetical protein
MATYTNAHVDASAQLLVQDFDCRELHGDTPGEVDGVHEVCSCKPGWRLVDEERWERTT